MTTGNTAKQQMEASVPLYYDGAYQNTCLVGKYASRVWSGGDLPPRVKGTDAYTRRFYTTVDQRGKVVKRSFRQYETDKVSKRKAPHDYNVTFRTFEAGPMYKVHTGVEGAWSRIEEGGLWTGSTWPPASRRPVAPALDANDQIRLVNKLKHKLRGSDFNMGIFLGEGHQALEMIGNTAIRIARGYHFARKGDFVRAVAALSHSAKHARHNLELLPKRLRLPEARRSAVDQLSSNWLELQYGWLPLLGDIRAGAEFVAHRLHVPMEQRYRVKVKRRNLDPKLGFVAHGAEHYAWTSRTIIAYISENPESLPESLGLLDPETVLWELTPFSFVVDWVTPIGSYLEARAFASRLRGTFVTTEYRREVSKGGLVSNRFTDGNLTFFGNVLATSDMKDEWLQINRSVSTSLAVPMPAVKPLSKILSWRHAVNSLALLAQVIKSPMKSEPNLLFQGKYVKGIPWENVSDVSRDAFTKRKLWRLPG